MKLGVTLLTGCNRKTPLGGSSNAWNIWAITWPCSTPPQTQHLHNGYFHVSINTFFTLVGNSADSRRLADIETRVLLRRLDIMTSGRVG